MITFIKGDITETDCNVILHGCNCFNTMGAGVALAIRNRWPRARQADMFTARGSREKLGTFSRAITQDQKVVYNLYTQFHYGSGGPHFDYIAFKTALHAVHLDLKYFAKDYSKVKIAMPAIGAGLAGGDWNKIKEIIQSEFSEETVYVYTL